MDIQVIKNKYKNKSITRKEILALGASAQNLKTWLNRGQVERISRGVYRLAEDIPEDEYYDQMFRDATKIIGPKSAVCLLSALEYYHLTDLISEKVWIMVPFDKGSKSKQIKLFRSRSPHWSVGILRKTGYRITSIERTLIDCLIHKSKIDRPTSIAAVKKAIKAKRTSIKKLGDMARQLKVRKRLDPVFEALI